MPAAAQLHYDALAGLPATKARPKIVEQLQRNRRAPRRASADHAPRQVLRKGRPAARDHHAAGSGSSRRWRSGDSSSSAAVSCSWIPEHMRSRYENWVNGLVGRLVHQPPAILRRAVPGVVSRPRGRLHRLRRRLVPPKTASCRSIRRRTCHAGYSRRAAWRAGRVHRRSRRHGHLGDVVADARSSCAAGSATRRSGGRRSRWTCVRRRTTSSARGCSRPCCDRISRKMRCRGRTRRFPAGCSIPTARRCRSRRATSSRPWACSRSTARTRCGTGQRKADPGVDTAFDAGSDAGRPSARDQAAQRVEVRARQVRAIRSADARARPRHGDAPRGAGADVDRELRGLRLHGRASRDRRRSSGGSATTTSNTSSGGARATAPDAASATAGCLAALVGDAAAVRAVPAVRDRRSLVVVAGGVGAPLAVACGSRADEAARRHG